jgi:tetratricopeptide (TPR) repeat protein
MIRAVLAFLAFLLASQMLVAQARVVVLARQPATRLERAYIALIEAYQKGDFAAAAELRSWKERDVRTANEALLQYRIRAQVTAPGQMLARFRAAAVMMHTDAGLAAATPDTVGSTHLDIAYRMMAPGTPLLEEFDARLDGFTLRNWLLAVTRCLVERGAHDLARGLLGARGTKPAYRELLEGADRELLLAAGLVEEGSSFFDERDLTSGAVATSGPDVFDSNQTSAFARRNQQNARQALVTEETRRRAEALYRRVLKLDAANQEARLRLGRVLFDRRTLDESAEHLAQVLTESRDARQGYLAALFLGGLHEEEGRLDTAVTAYSRALDLCPRCQTARIALASALERHGDAKAARATVLALAGRRAPGMRDLDPWWAYPLGQGAEGRAGMAQLRTAAAGQ